MTSSLVGSEMCIRDRVVEVCVQETGNQGSDWGIKVHIPPESPSVDEPVSYTHLTLPTICSV
eukprot:1769841-Prorocentrum_lima.AAC.1